MVKRCGYNIVRTRTITPNVWTVLQLRAMKQTVTCGQPNPIWNVAPSCSAEQTSVGVHMLVRKLLMLPAVIVIALTNRIVDILGFGDSLLVELRPDDEK